MSVASLDDFGGFLPQTQQKKRKSDVVEKKGEILVSSAAKRRRWIGENQHLEHEDLKMEDPEEQTGYDEEKEAVENKTSLEQDNHIGLNVRVVCKICKKMCIDERSLLKHEKIPHFWGCSRSDCNMAFATKIERSEHEQVHEQQRTDGTNFGLDHLVMNADGTMSFNHPRKSVSKCHLRHQENLDLFKLVNKSNYGSKRVKSNGSIYCKKKTNKNEKWKKADTEKFYKNLSIYGSNFALLAALFKGRSRKQLKNKFKKEYRENPKLIKEALTRRRPMELDVEEFEKVVTENMKAKQMETIKAGGGSRINVAKAIPANSQTEISNRATKVEGSTSNTTIKASKGKPKLLGLLELGPPPDAGEEKMLDDECSDFEFDPFA